MSSPTLTAKPYGVKSLPVTQPPPLTCAVTSDSRESNHQISSRSCSFPCKLVCAQKAFRGSQNRENQMCKRWGSRWSLPFFIPRLVIPSQKVFVANARPPPGFTSPPPISHSLLGIWFAKQTRSVPCLRDHYFLSTRSFHDLLTFDQILCTCLELFLQLVCINWEVCCTRPVESPHPWISAHTCRSCYSSRGGKSTGRVKNPRVEWVKSMRKRDRGLLRGMK